MADRFSLTRTLHATDDARRLFDVVRRLEAVFLPGVGMLGVSFPHAVTSSSAFAAAFQDPR